MALNLDVKFETPEEHFLKHKLLPYELPKFNPKSLSQTDDICKPADAELTPKHQEVDNDQLFILTFALKIISFRD